MASSSSSSSLASHRSKYDVFLNFRGEDTRRGFTSHLCAALRGKALQFFFDDDDLKRGEEIAPSLLLAIQESAVAILVFSQKYASSRWCLDELAEIIDCHHSHGQIVIPVFYEIDPSHLRRQSDDVAKDFVKHEQNSVSSDKIARWKKALTTAASLAGFDSKNFRNDVTLIEKIVEDILKKLNRSMTCGHLVGMNSRIKEIERLFTIDPCKTNILGICGMGGVGKTATAEVIYDIMSPRFEGRCLIENVRQRAEAIGLRNLLEELVSKALGKEIPDKNMSKSQLRLSLKKILCCKKMLIFLDDVNDRHQLEDLIGDVNDPLQAEYLIGDPISAGSMILITSRNKQVLGGRNGFIYEVEPLYDSDALHLFSKCAFKQNYPRDNYASLSISFLTYARGNPLALKVLGSALNEKNQEEWESALTQLSKVQNKTIYDALQISYDSLNRVEQDLFLDIACFFKPAGLTYVDQETLRKIYESSGFDITLSVLVDKCLVTSKHRLNMHDLLQEMGKEIVRRKAKNSRLWDPQDIYEVFVGNKEAEAVETITLDLSKITEMNLNPQVFTKMRKLRFLNFYGESNLHLSRGLDYLPTTLQYLRWDKYSLESLPPNFWPKNLVVLELSNSNIKQLWKKAKGDSLVSQPKYGKFRTLTCLSFKKNKSIIQLPNGISEFLEALEVLNLRGCSNLNTFPEIPSNVRKLTLSKTAIRQIHSLSDEHLSKLKYLEMDDCRELESLPGNLFSKLPSLKELDLAGCSRLKVLPKILEPMRYIKHICLAGTAIEKLPSFIGICNKKWDINMGHCLNCFSEDIGWQKILNLSNCNLRELPEDLSFLLFPTDLDLTVNDFERIPATFKQLSRLKKLYIIDCKRLLFLPELPSNVQTILAHGCRSLKEIWTLKQLPLNSPLGDYKFIFTYCLKLDEEECQEVVNALLRNYTRNQMRDTLADFKMIYPGSTMPKWVKYQNMGDSIQICLPSHWLNHHFLGFAFYLWLDDTQQCDSAIECECYFGDNYNIYLDFFKKIHRGSFDKEHMLVRVINIFCAMVRSFGFRKNIALFKFKTTKNVVKKCGVIPLYAQLLEDELCGTFDFPNLEVSKLKGSVTAEGSLHCMPQKSLKIEEIE